MMKDFFLKTITILTFIQFVISERKNISFEEIKQLNPYFVKGIELGNMPCNRTAKNCQSCDELDNCVLCHDDYFLDLVRIPKDCIPCPYGCKKCAHNECTICEEGYYLLKGDPGITESTCKKCSTNCKSCSGSKNECTECNDLYTLNKKTQRCVFKYTSFLIGFAVFFLIFLLIISGVIANYCLNDDSNKDFENILDKDEDLLNDAYKTEVKTIGITRKSNISDVLPPQNIHDSFKSDSDLHHQIFGGAHFKSEFDVYDEDFKFDYHRQKD